MTSQVFKAALVHITVRTGEVFTMQVEEGDPAIEMLAEVVTKQNPDTEFTLLGIPGILHGSIVLEKILITFSKCEIPPLVGVVLIEAWTKPSEHGVSYLRSSDNVECRDGVFHVFPSQNGTIYTLMMES